MGNSAEHVDVPAYLARLGLDREPPGVEALFRLHAAHIELVPYENFEIQLGKPTALDPAASFARIAVGRGGYCFHLNGAFSALLRALGYRVTRHLGGAPGHGEPDGIHRNHLALTVTGLPEDPAASWLVDVGLGDGLHLPIPLREGEYPQGPLRFAVRRSMVAPGGWRLVHDPAGSFRHLDIAPEVAQLSEFTAKHRELSTSPESGFVRTLVVQRRDRDRVHTLRALTLKSLPAEKTVLETPVDWWSAVEDVFGIPRSCFTGAERDRLWRQAAGQHERHIAERAGERRSTVRPGG